MKSIFLIEDDPAIITAVEARLSVEGYSVRTFPDGRGAMAELSRAVPDLILLDIMLPNQDGLQICRSLKEDPRTRSIPVIMVTVLSEISILQQAFAAGAVDYVCKPFSFEALLDKIRRQIG